MLTVADITSAGCIKLHWRKKNLEVDKFPQILSSLVVQWTILEFVVGTCDYVVTLPW